MRVLKWIFEYTGLQEEIKLTERDFKHYEQKHNHKIKKNSKGN